MQRALANAHALHDEIGSAIDSIPYVSVGYTIYGQTITRQHALDLPAARLAASLAWPNSFRISACAKRVWPRETSLSAIFQVE